MAVGMSMPVFASMLAFITYSLTDHGLNPAPIFSSLALFNSLRIPLNFLPLVIGQVIDANASVKRIQEFLLAEEAEEDTEWNYEAKEAVAIKDADFTWERHPTREDEDGPPGIKGPPAKKGKKEKKEKIEQGKSVQSVLSEGSGSTSGSVSKSLSIRRGFVFPCTRKTMLCRLAELNAHPMASDTVRPRIAVSG